MSLLSDNVTRLVQGGEILKSTRYTRVVLAYPDTLETDNKVMERHGGSKTTLYYIYAGMLRRCSNPNTKDYPDYGGRGIQVCAQWNGRFSAFRNWAFITGYRKGLLLDRKDPDGPYSPNNCRWVTSTASARNTRRNRKVTAFGETRVLSEWAEDPRCVVDYGTLWYRLDNGWDVEKAMVTPVGLLFAAFGETKSLREWSLDPRCQVSYKALCARISAQWPLDKAITRPGREGNFCRKASR